MLSCCAVLLLQCCQVPFDDLSTVGPTRHPHLSRTARCGQGDVDVEVATIRWRSAGTAGIRPQRGHQRGSSSLRQHRPSPPHFRRLILKSLLVEREYVDTWNVELVHPPNEAADALSRLFRACKTRAQGASVGHTVCRVWSLWLAQPRIDLSAGRCLPQRSYRVEKVEDARVDQGCPLHPVTGLY